MESFINFLESTAFANVCQFFSAIGTVGAVSVSLVITLSQNKIRTKITKATYCTVSLSDSKYQIAGFSATICNCSNEKNIYLKDGLYKKVDKKDKGKTQIILPVYELGENFIAPKILGPGEDYCFFISEKPIRWLLENYDNKKFDLYFMDKANKKYKFKIYRKELENELDYLEKNKDRIIPL